MFFHAIIRGKWHLICLTNLSAAGYITFYVFQDGGAVAILDLEA